MHPVLVVDDEPGIRRRVAELLEEELPASSVAQASTAAEALSLFARGRWSLVILDIGLPDRTGLEVLADLRRLDPGLPVVIISAQPADPYAEAAHAAGASAFIGKERLMDDLVRTCARLLRLTGGRTGTDREGTSR